MATGADMTKILIDLEKLDALEDYKADAIEALAENERVIQAQKERIEILEYHLGRVRDQAYLIITSTAGLVPIVFEPDEKPKKVRKVKA
jgi:hypothetical protein